MDFENWCINQITLIKYCSRDARRAKVRAEMEDKASKSRKKGFMTPERKKKLRV